MIVTPRIGLRIAAIVIVAVLLQLSFFAKLQLFQTSPDVLPAVVVALGLLGGSMTGAVCGFSIGLLLDSLLVEALGASSLVLLSTGYFAGLYRERFEITSRWIPPLLCMGLTLFAEAMFACVQLMLGVDAPVSAIVARDMLIKTIFAFFLAVPIYLGIRRMLWSALISERRTRPRPRPRTVGA